MKQILILGLCLIVGFFIYTASYGASVGGARSGGGFSAGGGARSSPAPARTPSSTPSKMPSTTAPKPTQTSKPTPSQPTSAYSKPITTNKPPTVHIAKSGERYTRIGERTYIERYDDNGISYLVPMLIAFSLLSDDDNEGREYHKQAQAEAVASFDEDESTCFIDTNKPKSDGTWGCFIDTMRD